MGRFSRGKTAIELRRNPIYKQVNHFFNVPIAGGIILFAFTILAMLFANIPATRDLYHHIWHEHLTIGFDNFNISYSLHHWINDGLMIIFFFVVGLEIKREIIVGELSSFRKAILPLVAAIGGMLAPAMIYMIFNNGTPTESGWGIPMATDIAFALGILFIMGDRVPISLKIFLTALAIADDLGAIIVIAMFYSEGINWVMLGWASIVLAFMFIINKLNIDKVRYYVIPGVILWMLFLNSGIHATIAGVLIAITIPTKSKLSPRFFVYKMKGLMRNFHVDKEDDNRSVLESHHKFQLLSRMYTIARETISPSQRLEHSMHWFVAYVIMPIFAFANAGITISGSDIELLASDQSLGIIFGLVLGKPLGIFILCFLTIKLGFAEMPKGASWFSLVAVGCMAGIGFTMSMFINNLAFSDPKIIDYGKMAILVASLIAALLGTLFVYLSSIKKRPNFND